MTMKKVIPRLFSVRLLPWLPAFLLLLLGIMPAFAQSGDVLVLHIEGPVTPAMRSYFERGILEGKGRDAEAVLIVLDTPGGSVDITLEIVQLFRRATLPIIVYIGPEGAQAASAGSIITAAAHAAGMAPQTVIGAASPVGSAGEDIEETLYRKLSEDLKATMRNLLAERGEAAVSLGEAMIEEARAVTADEARSANLIDAIAPNTGELLRQLDGKTVMVNGQAITLQLGDARQRPLDMSTFETILHALANPTLIAILLAIAIPAILIELQSPGGWVAGFIGVTSLILALYGAGQLPVNWLGLALVVIAFVLLLMEAFTPALGGLAIAGSVTLVAGLLIMFNSPNSPEFARLSIWAAIGISLPSVLFFLFVARLAARTFRQKPQTGQEGIIVEDNRFICPEKDTPQGEKSCYEILNAPNQGSDSYLHFS